MIAWGRKVITAREREVTSVRSDYHEANEALRNYHRYTDRQLRRLSGEKRFAQRYLASVPSDVVNDSLKVETSEGVYVRIRNAFGASLARSEGICNEDGYKDTRKDKRRAKTMRRKYYERVRRILASEREKSVLSSVVRKTGALLPAVAA